MDQIALTGGGTAGHVIPNIALIEDLKVTYPDLKILYIASKSPLEKDLLKDQPVKLVQITTGKLRRYFSFQNLIDLFKVPVAIIQAYRALKPKPKLLFSKGGYVALPVVIAAKLRGIPIIIHESDALEGLTTRISKGFATEYWSSYGLPGSKKVQLPVRKFLSKGDPKAFKSDKKTLLVMGGSLGAKAINDFITQNFNELISEFQIIHITGKDKKTNLSHKDYHQFEFVKTELADIYASSDLILSRAGANSLQEFAALNKKVILVPLATNASRGEQVTNAKAFAKNYQGTVIKEEGLSLKSFKEAESKLRSTQTTKLLEETSNITKLLDKYLTN